MFDAMRFAVGAALWTGVCAWAIARGGPVERMGGGARLLSALLTPFVQYSVAADGDAEMGVLAIDFLLFAFYAGLALKSDRWWTIFASAFLLCQAMTHVAKILDVGVPYFWYSTAAILWSYFALWALAFGMGQLEFERWKARRLVGAPAYAAGPVAPAHQRERERV